MKGCHSGASLTLLCVLETFLNNLLVWNSSQQEEHFVTPEPPSHFASLVELKNYNFLTKKYKSYSSCMKSVEVFLQIVVWCICLTSNLLLSTIVFILRQGMQLIPNFVPHNLATSNSFWKSCFLTSIVTWSCLISPLNYPQPLRSISCKRFTCVLS